MQAPSSHKPSCKHGAKNIRKPGRPCDHSPAACGVARQLASRVPAATPLPALLAAAGPTCLYGVQVRAGPLFSMLPAFLREVVIGLALSFPMSDHVRRDETLEAPPKGSRPQASWLWFTHASLGYVGVHCLSCALVQLAGAGRGAEVQPFLRPCNSRPETGLLSNRGLSVFV